MMNNFIEKTAEIERKRGMKDSEREISETGQDAAGRKYSAMNYVVGTWQRVLIIPCPLSWREALLVPPLSSSEIAPCLLHSHQDL